MMLAFAGAAALSGCGGNDKQAATVRLVNEPGKVELLNPPNTPGNQIWATFVMSESTHPTAIESPGTGGACLLADLNGFNLPNMASPRNCTKNADCQAGLNDVTAGTGGWWGYCDIEGDKKCWVRPGIPPKLCKKGALTKDTVNETPHYDLDTFKARFPGSIRWRAAACLNGFDGGPNDDCGLVDGGVRREVMGTPRAVP
jgi:hypothetical protein